MPPTTPWTGHKSRPGGLLSDRIQVKTAAATKSPAATKSSAANEKQSPAVIALRLLISNLQKDPIQEDRNDGCFCQGRVHPVSAYVKLCRSCGLILCELNQPYKRCPFASCGELLLAPHERKALVESLNEKIAFTIAEEDKKRLREDEERRRAAGAFPELGGSHTPAKSTVPSAPHKVLSLTSKGAVLTTTRKVVAPPPTTVPKRAVTPPPIRIPAPNSEPTFSPANQGTRQWESLRGISIKYVSAPKAVINAAEPSRRSRKSAKRANKEN